MFRWFWSRATDEWIGATIRQRMLYTHVLYLGLFLVVQKELVGLVSSFPGSQALIPSTSPLLSPHHQSFQSSRDLEEDSLRSHSTLRIVNQVHRHLGHQSHHSIQEPHFVINPAVYHTGVISDIARHEPPFLPRYNRESDYISPRDLIPAGASNPQVINSTTAASLPSLLPRGFDPNLFEYVEEEGIPEEEDDPLSPAVAVTPLKGDIEDNSLDSSSLFSPGISRTAPDTSATVWSNLKGNVVRVFNPVRISSRYNQGCVGGTKCQFFLVCWMSGGSLGSSCGPLYTCCVTPSSQEIQPAFYGPVVNDPYCGRSSTRISRIVGGSDASFGQFPWQVSTTFISRTFL